MEALAGGRAVFPTLHATFSADGNVITGRWEIAEDGTHYAGDFDLILRRVGGEQISETS